MAELLDEEALVDGVLEVSLDPVVLVLSDVRPESDLRGRASGRLTTYASTWARA